MDKTLNPERYGMTFCPDCKGKANYPRIPMALLCAQDVAVAGLLEKKRRPLKWKEKKHSTSESDKSK